MILSIMIQSRGILFRTFYSSWRTFLHTDWQSESTKRALMKTWNQSVIVPWCVDPNIA